MCVEDNRNSDPTLLHLEGVTKTHGAVRAADSVSFSRTRVGSFSTTPNLPL
jgi:hypothetical protein